MAAYKGPGKEEDPAEEIGQVRGSERPEESSIAEAKEEGDM